MEMAGRAAELTEYLIAVEALGRPKDFSSLEDSSVRNRAHELRQRLQKYYATENPHAALRIELHRGSYAPRFVSGPPAGHPEPDQLSRDPAPPVPDVRRPYAIRGWVGGFLAGILIAAAAGFVLGIGASRPEVDPAVRKAWAPLVAGNPEVLICMATGLYLQVSPFLAAIPESTPKYPAPKEMYALFSQQRYLPEDAKLEMQPVQRVVTMGDVQGLAQVLGVLHGLGSHYRIQPESNSPLAVMRGHNVVVLGSPWYSRAAFAILEHTPWTMALDEETHHIGMFGRGPQAGKKFLRSRLPHGGQEVFGLLSVLPNDQAAGGGHTMAVFSGLTSAGVNAAAAFFTSGPNLKDLAERFRREGLTAWPRSFQVVIRCRDDTQLLSYAYETHQVIEK